MSSVRNDQCLKEEIKRRKKKRMKLPRLSSSSPPSDIEISDSLNILHFNLANYSRRKKQNTYYAKHPFIRRRQWFNERLIREYRSPRRRKSSCLDFLIKKRMSKTHTRRLNRIYKTCDKPTCWISFFSNINMSSGCSASMMFCKREWRCFYCRLWSYFEDWLVLFTILPGSCKQPLFKDNRLRHTRISRFPLYEDFWNDDH